MDCEWALKVRRDPLPRDRVGLVGGLGPEVNAGEWPVVCGRPGSELCCPAPTFLISSGGPWRSCEGHGDRARSEDCGEVAVRAAFSGFALQGLTVHSILATPPSLFPPERVSKGNWLNWELTFTNNGL